MRERWIYTLLHILLLLINMLIDEFLSQVVTVLADSHDNY